MDWRVVIITYNVNMQRADEDDIEKLLQPAIAANPSLLVIGMQEVAHGETVVGGTVITWQRQMFEWMNTKSEGLVLLAKTYQMTNQVTIFVKRTLIPSIRQIQYRFSRNTMGGLTGHKGSIGVKISLQNRTSMVFVDSHFIHDVVSYDKRIAQFHSNQVCCFPDDEEVKAIFWLGDLNFRVEKDAEETAGVIKSKKGCTLLDSHDQLKRAMRDKEAFVGFTEAPITFSPTYRFYIGSTDYDLKRTPSWCDRILFKGDGITPLSYKSNDQVLVSDHIPVQAVFTVKVPPMPRINWDVLFEHLPTWYSTVPLVGRFQLLNGYWTRRGSYLDWVGVYPASIDDCTSPFRWVWIATCYDQTVQDQRYIVCEFGPLPEVSRTLAARQVVNSLTRRLCLASSLLIAPPPYSSPIHNFCSEPQKPKKMSYELATDGLYLKRGPPPMNPAVPEMRKEAEEFLSFLNKAVTPFHAVQECRERLLQSGFEEIPEADQWNIRPGGKYFVTKNRSTIIAFAIGGAYQPGNGFSIVVGHTDSPCLRVKPVSKIQSEKFNQVGVSTYGGGIWRTWFDRDLCVAGEVVVRAGNTLARRLINIDHPILYIPNLAIHLTKDRETFTCNTETELRPILESFAAAGINSTKKDPATNQADAPTDPRDIVNEHHWNFLEQIALAANTTPDQVVDMDLYLYDANPARLGGIHDEFITGARLDNLVGTFTAIQGLIASLADERLLADDVNIRIAACFDNEEVGSQTAMGAQSSFTEYVLRRLSAGGEPLAFEEAIARSMLISADQAHASHPNYASKHEDNHRPTFHGGVVVKVNVNQRYATTCVTHSVLKQIAAEANVPLQKMVVRNDSPCGSTVGPILACRLGLQTVDVGCPQLAMHSIREMTDTSSISQATRLYATFFNRMRFVLPSLI
ncbi:hypothetical protein RB195_008564 [Necator americanus]|uniref:Aspartyl aminopeptidase n=1 Tax=Necator americanus TaxID=51031 RepID=A0ABR1CP88_NECAM